MVKKYFLKWVDVLVVLKRLPDHKRYGQKVCKEMGGASSHIRNIIPWLEKHKMIRRKEGKKIKPIMFTEKGKSVTNDILKLKSALSIK
jgi:predicted transcriptional regulator